MFLRRFYHLAYASVAVIGLQFADVYAEDITPSESKTNGGTPSTATDSLLADLPAPNPEPSPTPAPILKFQKLPKDNDEKLKVPKIEDVAEEEDVPARTVYIEIAPNFEETASSQIQVRPYDQQWAEPYTFNIEHDKPFVRVRLTPGRYAIRTRALDDRKLPGNWSKWSDFWIRFKAPESLYPPDQAQVPPKVNGAEKITFEWPYSKEAVYYLFILKNKEGQILKFARTKKTWISVEVKTNSDYTWSVLPLSQENEWISKNNPENLSFFQFNSFHVLPGPENGKSVRLEVQAYPRALKYEYELLKFNRDDEAGPPSYLESYEPNFKVQLAPGSYEMRVRMYLDNGTISHWSSPYRFFVQFDQPKSLFPANGGMVDSTDDDVSKVLVKYEGFTDVGKYVIYVYSEKGELLKQFESQETETVLQLPHDATYRWQVMAYGPGEPLRDPPPIDENTYKFSINTYVPLLLSATEEPSHIYSWGRYWISYMDYVGKNYDANSLIQQPILGGTGELALGYWHRKSGYGLLMHGSLSGFSLDSGLYNYAEGGIDVGRRIIYPDGARLRYWLGVSYREFPEFVANSTLTAYGFTRIKNWGPQAQVSYMDQFDDKYGWHAYGVLYYGVGAVETPGGAEQVPQLSMTLGIFGTYRSSQSTKWMVGYSYRQENVAYKSADRTGRDNQSQVSGHFLNLSLEMSLTSDYYK